MLAGQLIEDVQQAVRNMELSSGKDLGWRIDLAVICWRCKLVMTLPLETLRSPNAVLLWEHP